MPKKDKLNIEQEHTRTILASAGQDEAAIKAAEMDVPVEWNVGDVILDRYEVNDVHEGGGMGLVYKVHHRGWKVELAVKSPRRDFFQTEALKENFIRECETWINLGLHPNIVSCYYVRTLGDIPRVFAEYVEGGSLADWIQQRKLYEGGPEKALERILDVAIQSAWGLQYAHEQGLIHQDVKPANVMITPEVVAKVADFGLAKARAITGEVTIGGSQQSILVSTGGMTPAYCSPEQANKEKLSRKTDIWSWGLSILEMFTGEVTWMTGLAAVEALESFLETGSNKGNIPKMPAALAELLRQCFQWEPEKRPKDMLEIVAELKKIYKNSTDKTYPRDKPEPAKMSADSLNNQAISYMDIGKEYKAIALWQEALKSNPHQLEANFNYGYFRWQGGEILDDEYVNHMRELEHSKITDSNYWRCLSWIHFERGDLRETERLKESEFLEDEKFFKALEHKNRPRLRRVKDFEERYSYFEPSCFSPDGRKVFGLESGKASFFDLASGKYSNELKIPTRYFCLSADGCYILSGSGNNNIHLWDVESGKELKKFSVKKQKRWEDSITTVCFSPDGNFFLSCSKDQTIRLWEVATGEELRKADKISDKMVISIRFSPNGRYFVAKFTSQNYSRYKYNNNSLLNDIYHEYISIWDVLSWKEVLKFDWYMTNCVCFSPDFQYALTGGGDRSSDGKLSLWNIVTGEKLRQFEWLYISETTSVCFSPDGKYALSGDKYGTTSLWDVESGNVLKLFKGHDHEVRNCCFSPDGRHFVSSDRYCMRIWETETGKALNDCCHSSINPFICFSPDSRHFILNKEIWEINFPKKYWEIDHPYPLLSIVKNVETIGMEQNEAEEFKRTALDLMAKADFFKAYKLLRKAQSVPGLERNSEILGLITECGLKGKGKRKGLKNAWCFHTLEGDAGVRVLSVCFSPDGKYVLSGGLDNIIRLWEVESGKELRRFEGHTDFVASVCFSPDGRHVLSGSGDKTIRLWEVESGKELRQFEGHTDTVRSICFSPDGRYVLSGSEDKTIRLWEVESGKELRRFEGHTPWVKSICFSPDGKYALSGSQDKTIRLWEVENGKELRRFEGHTSSVKSVCFSSDGRCVLSGSWDKSIRLWEVESGKELRRLEGHTSGVISVCFSPDGRYVLSGSKEGDIKLWEFDWDWEFPEEREMALHIKQEVKESLSQAQALLDSGDYPQAYTTLQQAHNFQGYKKYQETRNLIHEKEANVLLHQSKKLLNANNYLQAYGVLQQARSIQGYGRNSEIGKLILATALQGKAKRKGLKNAWCSKVLEVSGEVNSVCFSPDGKYVLSGHNNSYSKDNLQLWDIATGNCTRTLETDTSVTCSACFSPDGKYALLGSLDKTLRLWDINTGRCIRTFEGHNSWINSVCFSPDGKYVLSGSSDYVSGRAEWWDKILRLWWDKTIWLWDINTGKCLNRMKGYTSNVSSVCFSPDGKHALSCGSGNTIRLWEVATSQCLKIMEGHTDGVNSVCFSPDGKYALSGSYDNTLRLWEVATGQCLKTMEGHTKSVSSVCFSPDGKYALSGGYDNTLRLWSLAKGSLINTLGDTVNKADFPNDKIIREMLKVSLIKNDESDPNIFCFNENITIDGHSLSVIREKAGITDIDSFYAFIKRRHTGEVTSVSFSPDGNYAISGSSDRDIRLWEFDWDWEFPEDKQI